MSPCPQCREIRRGGLATVNAENHARLHEALAQPCPRCGAPVPILAEFDVTRLGDPERQTLLDLGSCPTEGCGTTCVTCHRTPGEVHGPHCWDRMRLKIENPHIVDRSDCLA